MTTRRRVVWILLATACSPTITTGRSALFSDLAIALWSFFGLALSAILASSAGSSTLASSCAATVTAARSMTFTPASNRPGTIRMAVPLGVAKKTRSQLLNSAMSGSRNTRSTLPRRFPNISATGVPASEREVITSSVTRG